MKLDLTNMFVKQEGEKYAICISMEDGTRNYVHSQLTDLESCYKDLDELIDMELDKYTIQIENDGSYFRIWFVLLVGETADRELHFHSRKLNLNDAILERRLLIEPSRIPP